MITIIKKIVILFFVLNAFSSYTQTDTINLKETEISSSRVTMIYDETSRVIKVISKQEIETLPIQNINELLEYAVGADIRQRGELGVQADVSFRGGSFEQTLILLNGVKMNDPQTGHHNMNLPIELRDIERIEILHGPGSRIYGANAFAGAINIITGVTSGNNLRLSVSGGDYNFYNLATSISVKLNNLNQQFSFSKKKSDGYRENTDFELYNFFYQSSYFAKFGILNIQAGYNNKKFGANSFYTAKYPNQFEQTETFFANGSYKTQGKFQLSTQAYIRTNKDRFELFRSSPPSWYKNHNYHSTIVAGIENNVKVHSCLGKSAIGFELRSEKILSNVLGELLDKPESISNVSTTAYTRGHERNNLGFFAEHLLKIRHLNISGGMFGNFNSDFGRNFSGGIDLSYDINKSTKWFLSVNHSFRIPTYTDLYYVGPTNLGNKNLKPEEAIAYESGLKYNADAVNAHISFFFRNGENMIDWVKYPDSSKWESKNITQINTVGAECIINIDFTKIFSKNVFFRRVNFSYAYLSMIKKSDNLISYYLLDYLKNKAVLNLDHRIFKKFSASWAWVYQERLGTYTEFVTGKEVYYNPFVTTDLKLIYKHRKNEIFIETSNILDVKYNDFGNIPSPGRWTKVGFVVNFF